MTKKSKKKAVKTGLRTAESPRVTTYSFGSNITQQDKNSLSPPVAQLENDAEFQLPQKYLTKGEKRRLKEQKCLEIRKVYEKENNKRLDYPVDLWFLISQYILPEEVNTFSVICKGSYYVCSTKKFWMDLYKRCITDFKSLPSHLKPKSITTDVGLQVRVVRSIFHAYRPLAEKYIHNISFADSPERVEFKTCESFWFKQLTSSKRNINVWMFYFKLIPHQYLKKKLNIFKLTNLISYNPDEHCCILRVTASSLINMQNIGGLHLTGMSISVSRDMRHHKLKLTFHEYSITGRYCDNQGISIFIDPMLDIQILNWWHPEYPHPFDN